MIGEGVDRNVNGPVSTQSNGPVQDPIVRHIPVALDEN